MPKINFTSNLKRFFPQLSEMHVEKDNLPDILDAIEISFPGIKDYIVDETGMLRKHVNIYIGEDLITDRIQLSDPVRTDDEIYIMQALSGG